MKKIAHLFYILPVITFSLASHNLVWGCGTMDPNRPAQMFKREISEILPEHKISPNDNFFNVKINSSTKPVIKFNKNRQQYSFSSSIGTGKDIVFKVLRGRADIATMVYKAIDQSITTNKSVKGWNLKYIDAGVLKAHPYIYTKITYWGNLNGKSIIGEAEHFIWARLESTIIISHDEPGFSKTFFNMAKHFTESFKVNEQIKEVIKNKNKSVSFSKPSRRLIYIMSLNKKNIGFWEFIEYYTIHSNKTYFLTSFFTGSNKMDFTASDDVQYTISDMDGFVTRMEESIINNGNSGKNLTIKKISHNQYNVTGTIQHKKINSDFTTSTPIMDDRKIRKMIKQELFEKKSKRIVFPIYFSSYDPFNSVESEIIHLNGFIVRQKIRGFEIESELDSEAILQKMEFDIADNKMIMSLMWKNE